LRCATLCPPLQAPRTLLARRNSGEPEAAGAVYVRLRHPVAPRRPAATVEPAAAPEHPEHPVRAPREGGLTPLPGVAVPVVATKSVGLVRAHFRRAPQPLALRGVAGGFIAVEVGLLGGEVVGRLLEVEVEGAVLFRRGPSSTSILPFLLGRQAVQPSTPL